MDHKLQKEEKTLSRRCLALVFRERKSRTKTGKSRDAGLKVNEACKSYTELDGKSLYSDFIEENKCCFWDPHLEESVKCLKYEGHVQPHTVLVTGRDIYLDTVKAAWSRRALRTPQGYALHRVGEVSSIEMTTVPQTQFTPLPEALCIIISDLSRSQTEQDASFDTILDRLKDTYRGMEQPNEQIVYEALGCLIKERKIYHTGSGYHILTPDLFQPGANCVSIQDHHLVIGGGDTQNGITPTIYIPLMSPSTANAQNDMRSISCQTEQKSPDTSAAKTPEKEDKLLDDSIDKEKEKGKKKFERSQSVREKKSKKEKEKEKDREKDREKEAFTRSASLRYSEEKAKAMVKDINLKTSDIHQDKDKGEKTSLLSKLFGRNTKSRDAATGDAPSSPEQDSPQQVELATFSAQFPPPEWNWYESQVKKLVQHQQHHPKDPHHSNTWHHGLPPPEFDLDPYSEVEGIYDEIHARDCPVSRSRTLPAELGQTPHKLPPHMYESSTSQDDSWSSLNDLPVKPPLRGDPTPQKPLQVRSRPMNHNRSHERYSSGPDGGLPNENGLSPDVRPKEPGFMNRSSSPLGFNPRQPLEGPPVLNSNGIPPERPSHVTKVFKKYREMKCPRMCSNDITVEYCGSMPKKGLQMGMSRDSGVNCIGLNNNNHPSSKPQLFGKNHYNSDQANQLNNQVEAPSKPENPAVPNNLTVHQAQVHHNSQPHPSQEDSGFISPQNGGDHLYNQSSVYNRVPYFSTPNNLSSNQPPNGSPEDSQGQSTDHNTTRSSSVSYTSSEGAGMMEERNPMKPRPINNAGHSEGSGNSLWSESSKQTVMEIKPGPRTRTQSPPPARQMQMYHRSGSSPPTSRRHSSRDLSPIKQPSKCPPVSSNSYMHMDGHNAQDSAKKRNSYHSQQQQQRHNVPMRHQERTYNNSQHHRSKSPTRNHKEKDRHSKSKHQLVNGRTNGHTDRAPAVVMRNSIRESPRVNSNYYNLEHPQERTSMHLEPTEPVSYGPKKDYSFVGVI